MKHFKTTKNPEDFKNLKKKIHEPKASRLLANVCNFQKEKKILWYGLKIYRKSIAWTKYFYSLWFPYLFLLVTKVLLKTTKLALHTFPEKKLSWRRHLFTNIMRHIRPRYKFGTLMTQVKYFKTYRIYVCSFTREQNSPLINPFQILSCNGSYKTDWINDNDNDNGKSNSFIKKSTVTIAHILYCGRFLKLFLLV